MQGQGEGVRVQPTGEALPCLTSLVSVSRTALFPLMAATLRSSRKPFSSLPVMRSHRADSASHLGRGQGTSGGSLSMDPRAWLHCWPWVRPTQASQPLFPPLPRGVASLLSVVRSVGGGEGHRDMAATATQPPSFPSSRLSSLLSPSSLHWVEVGDPCSPVPASLLTPWPFPCLSWEPGLGGAWVQHGCSRTPVIQELCPASPLQARGLPGPLLHSGALPTGHIAPTSQPHQLQG